MPVYKYNGKTYDIPEDVVSDFEKDMPGATLAYQVDDKVYDIPVSEKQGFLETYPTASLYAEEPAKPAMSPKEELDAFYQENGTFMDDYEKRDSLDQQDTARNAMVNEGFSFFKPKSRVSDEERTRYKELAAQRKALEKAWYTSDEYLSQQERAAGELAQIQKEITNERKVFSAQNPYREMPAIPAGGVYVPTTGNPAADHEHKMFEIADRIMSETIKLHNAPNKYGSQSGLRNMGVGAKDKITDPAFLTMGLSKITDDLGVRDVLAKIQEKRGDLNDLSEDAIDGILTPAEKAVLKAWALNAQEQLARQGNLSLGYQAGQSATESLEYMAEFALTGGVGKLASEGVEGMAKWLAKNAYKIGGLADDAAEVAVRELGEKMAKSTVGKYGVGLAKSLAETAGKTMVMPSTYKNIAEKATEIQEDENGNRHLVELNDAFAEGYVDSFIENLSEGGRVNVIGELVGDVAGKIPVYKKLVDKFSKTKASELLTMLNSTGVMNTLRAGGWHGFGEEYLEEWYGNALRTLTGVDKEALKDFATVDNQIVTITSFLPMTIFGGTVSTAQVLSANKDLEKKAAALKSALMERGYDEAQADNMIDMMRGATPSEVSGTLSPIITKVAGRDTNEARELAKPAMEFAWAVSRYQSYGAKYEYQQQGQRDGLRAEMEQKLGKFWMEDENGRQTVQRGVNEKGEVVYLLGKQEVEDVQDGLSVAKEVAAINSEGKPVFVFPSDYQLEDELEMNDFLATEIMAEKGSQERTRKAQERDIQVAEIRQKAAPGTTINIGTVEAPVMAEIAQRGVDGVIVTTQSGEVRQIGYVELGKYLDVNTDVYSDAELDEQEADALSADRSQREAALDQEYDNDAEAIEELAEAEQEIEQSIEAVTPLPTKEDGTVDQNALWNNDPERWAQWNDEQRQDGGANSLAYVSGAIAKEQDKIAELQAAYAAESDFDARDAIEKELTNVRERILRLAAIQQSYAAQAEAQTQSTQQQTAQPVQPAPQLTEEEKAALEEERRKPLRAKAKELSEKLGVKVKIAEDLSDVQESKAREQLLKSAVSNGKQKVAGWYNQATGEVTIFLPHAESVEDVEKTFIHEVVAHKGLRGLLGEEGFNVLCDAVWDMMSESDRTRFINYPGVNGDKRAAADEYMAHFAENLNLEEAKPDMWERIVAIIKQILDSMGVRLRINQEGLSSVIAASYQKLLADAKAAQDVSAESVTEATTATGTESQRSISRGNNFESDDFFNDNTPASAKKQLNLSIEKGKKYPIAKLISIYEQFATNKEQMALAKRVFAVAEQLGLQVSFLHEDLGFGIGGRQDGNIIKIARITTLEQNQQKLADILLHETIHGVTTYAIDAYKNGELTNPKMIEAVEEILEVYREVKNDKSLSGEYGLTNEKEMIAEMANPSFRQKLKNINVWEKIKNAIKKLFFFDNAKDVTAERVLSDALDKLLDNYDLNLFNEYEVAREINEEDWNFYRMHQPGSVTAEQNHEINRSVRGVFEIGAEANEVEEPTSPILAAAQQEGESIRFSITTEESLQEKIRNFAKTKEGKATGWTEDDIESIIAETESLIDAIHKSSTGNEFYDEFAYKEPTIRVGWRDGEAKPIVTWTRANIEYKYDMSADLLCINNEGLEQVLSSDKMVALMEMFVPEKKAKKGEPEIKFTSEDYLELYNTLKDLGFVVPCKGCFDAAGRFKMLPSVAQKFAAEVNAVIDERNKDPKAFDDKLKAKSGEKTIDGLPTTASTKSAAIAVGVAGDNLTEHVKWTQLMSADGQTKMLSDWGGIFRAWQRTGAGRPKDKLLPEPYYGDIVSSVSTIIGKYGEKTPSFRDILVNQGTGLRRNSHSEFRPVLAIDEIQFMRDAFIRNLTVFKYMKELDDVRLFGKMGVKFNMSFFPEYVPGTKVAGLDKDGNYIASEESVGSREFPYQGEDGKRHYDGMKGWAEAQKYINKDVSLSSVIFSIPHLLKALTDVPTPSDMRGIWGSLIPFHSSGATTASLAMQGLGMARANGVGHGFIEAFSDYGKGVTNFEAVQNDRFGEGWYIVSGKKAGENVEPGHKLEFANGNHYYNQALGVHLFASGYILDSELPEGALAENGELNITDQQKKALMHNFTIDYNDKVRELKGPYAYKDAADYYISELPKLGLIPRFDFEVSEEKFIEMCGAANVDPRHPKLGWKGEGNSWSPIDSEAYYSLFCDYGMTDPTTGEWAPHMPVGYVNEEGQREFRLPENAVEIVKEGLDRFSEVRRSENARIDEAIEKFAERSVEKGRISQKSVDKVLGKKSAPKKSSKSKQSGVIDLVEEAKKAVAREEAKGNVSFRITPEMDKAYMDAVEAGDMETAQRLVIEAAKLAMPNTKVVDENGNPLIVYHGSPNKFTTFDIDRFGRTDLGSFGKGFYFTSVESRAKRYGENVAPVFLNVENPINAKENEVLSFVFGSKDKKEVLDRIFDPNDNAMSQEEKEAAAAMIDDDIVNESKNYDGTYFSTARTAFDEVVVRDASQIKSADPVTYDDNGNVIPLSERFNPENEDIRFRFTPRTEEQREQLFDNAKEKFGLTNNFKVAGYMLPDGSLLDFSEANDGGDPNQRSLDHRSIEDVIMEDGTEYESRWMYLADFMNEGAIRLLPEYAGINLMKAPTKEQRQKLFDFIYKYNGEVILEIADEQLNNVAYVEYDRRTSPSRIFRDIDGYFNEGIVPQQDIRFRVLDTTNAELKEKPIKLNGMYRFNLKNAFKGVKDNGGSYPYIKVQLEEVPEDYSGDKITYNGILEGFAVVRIPKGLITEGEKDNVFFIDPKDIEKELWDVLRATENYYEFKHGGAPYQRDWLNTEGVRFRIANENQAIFVSNAAKAVGGIKMEKATPEQWLKMIEKNGGLKAGEDKWMGLSDWLKASDKKTLTKQEVLDFVNEHMIQIEEQHYSEDENALDGKRQEIQEALQGIFDEYVAESEDMNDDMFMNTHYNYAIQKLADELGYTVFNAPFVNNNAIVELDFYEDDLDTLHELSNKLGLEKYDGTRNINDTRLSYTTEGLTDRHEIALTVPTIEPWGERDEVHFGDAGDGRAVAWIRFGDASKWVPEQREDGKKGRTKKVLVIDEIQSKRHQEGREKGYKSDFKNSKEAQRLKAEVDRVTARLMELVNDKRENEERELTELARLDIALDNATSIAEYDAILEEQEKIRTHRENREAEEFAVRGERRELDYLLDKQIDRDAVSAISAVADAPFDKNWHELAMKRMLRYAAENGYDVIAWTKGDQQAERYNLGKIYNEIEREDNPNIEGRTFSFSGGNYDKVTVNEDGVVVDSTIEEAKGKPLGDLVGKDLAVKMMSLENYDTIDGEDLRIGGEGMKGFYDRMLPAFMNKYGKKWGVKVEDIHLNLEGGLDMHSVPVTEEMKASVMEGQVMFRIREEGESAMDFHQSALNDFKEEYNVPTSTTIVDVNDRDAVAVALGYAPEVFTDEQYNYILNGYKRQGTGVFDPETKRIAIFVKESKQKTSQIYNDIFHENTHWLVDRHPELLELGEWLWQNAESGWKRKLKESILAAEDMYEAQETDEMLSAYTGFIMSLGKADVAYQKTPSELQKHWELIFNAFGYGPKRENDLRGRGTRDNSGRVGSSRDGRNAKQQKYNNASQGTLTAEERRIIGEYFPEFNKSEDVRMRVNSQGKELTEGQEEFFANSKAVDKDGNLLVLYHGTPRAGFTEFKSGWFTTSKEDAISYSGDRKGRLFDPNEKYEQETLTAGDFRLGYMTFDSEEDRVAFLERFPYADEVMSEREYEDARMGAEDEEYDALTARRKEFAEVWNAYREYERDRFVDTPIADLIANPEAYTEEDLMRAMLEYDSNATFDSLDDMSAEERKDALVSALQTANEETEGGILDMVVPTRVPRNGEGLKHNDLGNRTYEVYANVENPYEIDANGRGSEFESGDIYKAVEEALADEQYDGVIVRNWRVGRTQQLGDVVVPKDGDQIKLTSNENPTESDDVRFKVVTDPAKIEELEDGPKVEAYRAVQIDKNGKIYSPMASRLKSTKKGTKQATNEAAQMNQWDEAIESLDKVDENGKITILDEDGGTTKVAYNPYGHCCVNSMMNDQFKRAWERDGLYVMKVLAPESELTAGYHAEKAKDAVGIHKWKTGAVGNKLPENKRREILLTRWMKNIKVMPWEEVAQDWIKTLEGENVDVPFNVVPRKILNMLAEAGVKIVAPEKGMENATKAYEQWLADPKGYVGNTELPDHVKALNEETDDEGPDNEPRFRTTGTPTDEVVANGLQLTSAQTAEVAASIFAALPEERRKKITEGLNGNILGLKDAILQIPASLASKENWNDEDKQMADVVAEEMTKIAGEMTRPFSAEEGLWLLYNNLNKGTDLISQASRALVQRNLGFDAETLAKQEQAKEDVRLRTVGDATSNAQASLYNRGAVNVWTRLKESFVDMQASVEELVKAIEKRTGKVAQGFENILLALNQQSSKGLAAMESYTQKFLNPMFDEIRRIMDDTKMKYEDIVRYVILKHGLERNKKLAQRDARAHYQEIYDDIISKITGMTAAQKRTYLTNAQLKEGDAKAELATLQAVDMSAMTDEEKGEHKKKLAAARKAVEEAEEHLKRAQKIASLSEQEAQDELDKIFENIENEMDSVYKEMRENDYSGISSMFYDQLGVDRKNFSTEEQYQAALMEAKKDRYSSLKDIEAAAEAEVKSFEGKTDTKELWKRINAATKETLRQQYEANMISKDQYDNLRGMFEYYVPLRGFKDNTAEDMYTYYRKPNSTGYTKPILGAEGRKTEAESPFGWIAAMAGSAIASNVKNEAKLALYYFVSNRPENGIATISRTWFVDSGEVDERGKKIFKPAYPPFSEDLSSDAAKANYEAWQENMRELQKKGQAYEAGQRLNLGNAVVNISDANKPEHIVNVKVGGKDYTIIINGNPRAAQAINGDLNIEGTAQDYSALFGPVLRWMSSVNTSYNPEFWITNMMRDMAFTMMAVNIKEDTAYRRKFSKNYRKAFKVISLAAKNENGTIGDSYLEEQYKDFVKYGGVTGYTQIKDSETWEKEIDNYLSSNDPESVKNGKVMRGMKSAFHAAHRFGESLEQVSRFAAFLTARETGKSINEAINDAKEITVNFNRKGSGKMITLEEAKYLTGKNGQPLTKFQQWMAVGLSSIAPLGRRSIMFFNAAIQGLNATYKLMKKNPKRFTGWALGYAAVGMMNAVLHALMDDDDDYLDIPQYERRNSLMIGGNGAYFKWALPQEARAFYALGDLAVETVMGRNPHQNFLGEALKIGTEILPVNPSEGWKAFVPSVAIPVVELMINEDYKGAPIYNEQKWLSEEEKERTAKWSSAYQGTGWMYVKIAQGLNFITGGDKHDAGWINLQPEKLEHLVQSAFGGTIRTADKFINTISAAIDPEEPNTIRQAPFLNRFLTINDERFKNVHVNDVFDYYKADAEHALTLEKQYIKDRDMDSLTELRGRDEYQWAKIYGRYKKPLKAIQDKIKVADGTAEKKELMKQQDELKKRMIKQISEL